MVKRFYKEVSAEPSGEGWQILLDGKPIRTPQKHALVLPNVHLADLVKAEWDAVEEKIDPRAMPATGLAHAAIDALPGQRPHVIDELAAFGETDLLYYRAPEQALAAKQAETWDPVLRWAEGEWGIRFTLVEGIMPVAQPEETPAVLRAAIEKIEDWPLAAFTILVHKLGSLLLALAVYHKHLTWEQAFAASRVDEAHQLQTWGEDEEAVARGEGVKAEIQSSSQFLAACVD